MFNLRQHKLHVTLMLIYMRWFNIETSLYFELNFNNQSVFYYILCLANKSKTSHDYNLLSISDRRLIRQLLKTLIKLQTLFNVVVFNNKQIDKRIIDC